MTLTDLLLLAILLVLIELRWRGFLWGLTRVLAVVLAVVLAIALLLAPVFVQQSGAPLFLAWVSAIGVIMVFGFWLAVRDPERPLPLWARFPAWLIDRPSRRPIRPWHFKWWEQTGPRPPSSASPPKAP